MQSTIELKIPPDFNCPISHEPMTEPVMSPIGRSFQKEELEQAVRVTGKDPLTNKPLNLEQITPNPALKLAMQDYHQAHEKKLHLNQIYQQRGTEKIEALTKTLQEINNAIQLEQQEKLPEFKMNHEALSWPFPLVCPRSCTVIKNPVTAPDGMTYEKSMAKNVKQRLLPNLTLKEILPLFHLELDDALKDQFKQINSLRRETQNALEAYEQLIQKKLQRQQNRKRKIGYLWRGTAILAAIYSGAYFIDYYVREVFDAHNELAPLNDRWGTTSDLLRPFVTLGYVLSPTDTFNTISFHRSNYEVNRLRCRTEPNSIPKPTACGNAIHFALRYRRYLTLKKSYEEKLPIRYFAEAAEHAVRDGDVEGLEILYRLNPEILQVSNQLMLLIVSTPMTDDRRVSTIHCLNLLLTLGYSIDRAPKHWPTTPLMTALENNNLDMAELLIAKGASLKSKNGNSPLRFAIGKNNLTLVTKIVEKDPESAKQILLEHRTLIEELVEQENIDMLKILLNYFPVNGVKNCGCPLLAAIKKHSLQSIDFLINKGADIRPGLMYVAQHGYFKEAKEILKINSIDRETIKIAMIEAHKSVRNHAVYNLLRARLRSMDGVVVPHRNAFYQPASVHTMGSKYSQRQVRNHR